MMRHHNGTPAAPPSADSMAGALEEYLAAVEAGTAPPREEFLACHPELAEDLDACLAALRFIGRAAEALGGVPSVARSRSIAPDDRSSSASSDCSRPARREPVR